MKFIKKDRWRDLKLALILGICLIMMEIILRNIIEHESILPWEKIPGFYALFGFLGCLLLSAFSKFVGRKLLMREPDYYKKRRCQR